MSFCNNEFVQGKHLSTQDENFMEVTEATAVPECSGFSGNFEASSKGFELKNCFSNQSSQGDFVQKSSENTLSNTAIAFGYRKESEEEFTTWPKRRIKLQGGSLFGDKQRATDARDIIPECHLYLELPSVVSDNRKPLETQPKYVVEDNLKMDCTSTESFDNLPEEFSSCGSLLGNDAVDDTTNLEPTASAQSSNSELYAGIRKHILDLPDLVLEHILGYVDLKDLSQNIRPVCRTFYNLSSRILRLAFKNMHTQLSGTLQKLENEHPTNWNPICAEVLTCKLLQSEMDTLRAACSRQIESGQSCFIQGDVLQGYHSILQAVQIGKINVMLDGFSETLIKLNEKPLQYWDSRYDDEDMPIGDLKLLGVEIVEILLSALNSSGCIVITYQPPVNSASSSDDKQGEDVSGSCMMAGCVSINRSTELKPPAIDRISLQAQRRAILRYVRSLVRANNCDIVLYKLRAYSKEKEVPLPVFEHKTWTLCSSKVTNHNTVQESYKREPVIDYTNTPIPDCNMQIMCNFEMFCPKRINPFGIALNRRHQSPVSSEVFISEEKDEQEKNLADILSGDHYIFKMDFKTWAPGNNHEMSIEMEHYVTKSNKWCLNITSNSSSID